MRILNTATVGLTLAALALGLEAAPALARGGGGGGAHVAVHAGGHAGGGHAGGGRAGGYVGGHHAIYSAYHGFRPPTHWRHGGGGHGYGHYYRIRTYYFTYYTLASGAAAPRAVEAVDPVDPVGASADMDVAMDVALTDAPPTFAEGDMRKGDVVDQHQLRAVDARVLTEPVTGLVRTLPAGAGLARVTTGDPKIPVLWCDMHANATAWPGRHDCLADSRGTGKFDQIWVGESYSYFLGLAPASVHDPRPLAQPVGYRDATPEERPVGVVGFKWCDGDGVNSPPRFSLALSVPSDSGWTSGGPRACMFGHWPDPADKTHVLVDGRSLIVQPGAQPGVLHYRFETRLAPAAKLAAFEPGQPLRPADQVPAKAQEAAALEAEMAEKALLSAKDAPPAVQAGPLVSGQAFLSASVRHGVTGVLRNEISSPAAPGRALEVGQPVYGVPMAGLTGSEIVWCAPRLEAAAPAAPSSPPKAAAPLQPAAPPAPSRRWTAVCMPNGYWVETRPALLPANLAWTATTGEVSSPPSVERKPVDLPPMTLSYAFGGWNESGWMVLNVQLDWGEGPQIVRTIYVPAAADGTADLRLMGGRFGVRRSGDQAVLQVLQPPQAGAAAVL